MNAITEFAAAVDAHLDAQDTSLSNIESAATGVRDDVSSLKAEIEALQQSLGSLSPDDQATLDRIKARLASAAANVEAQAQALSALDALTPPKPPTEG